MSSADPTPRFWTATTTLRTLGTPVLAWTCWLSSIYGRHGNTWAPPPRCLLSTPHVQPSPPTRVLTLSSTSMVPSTPPATPAARTTLILTNQNQPPCRRRPHTRTTSPTKPDPSVTPPRAAARTPSTSHCQHGPDQAQSRQSTTVIASAYHRTSTWT